MRDFSTQLIGAAELLGILPCATNKVPNEITDDSLILLGHTWQC